MNQVNPIKQWIDEILNVCFVLLKVQTPSVLWNQRLVLICAGDSLDSGFTIKGCPETHKFQNAVYKRSPYLTPQSPPSLFSCQCTIDLPKYQLHHAIHQLHHVQSIIPNTKYKITNMPSEKPITLNIDSCCYVARNICCKSMFLLAENFRASKSLSLSLKSILHFLHVLRLKISSTFCTYGYICLWRRGIPIGCYPSAVRVRPSCVSKEELMILYLYVYFYFYLYLYLCVYSFDDDGVFVVCIPPCRSVVYLVSWEPTSFPWVKGFYCLTNHICLL